MEESPLRIQSGRKKMAEKKQRKFQILWCLFGVHRMGEWVGHGRHAFYGPVLVRVCGVCPKREFEYENVLNYRKN